MIRLFVAAIAAVLALAVTRSIARRRTLDPA